MKFESFSQDDGLTPEEIKDQERMILRYQMQFALAFINVPETASDAEEKAIIEKRIKKNSPRFSEVFDKMEKENPNLFNDWKEDSKKILEDLKRRMEEGKAKPNNKFYTSEGEPAYFPDEESTLDEAA